MPHIAIPIPTIPGKQEIEIDVTINGQKQQLHYRVEFFYWSDCEQSAIDRADCIQKFLSDYDSEWMLYYIGAPTDNLVPITFVKRADWWMQRKWMTVQQ
jgi:hypothetical protein